jgi:hypothetical protein
MNDRKREASRDVIAGGALRLGLRELSEGDKSAQLLTDGSGDGPLTGFGEMPMEDIVRRSSGLEPGNGGNVRP